MLFQPLRSLHSLHTATPPPQSPNHTPQKSQNMRFTEDQPTIAKLEGASNSIGEWV
jgi:hypothetical protein